MEIEFNLWPVISGVSQVAQWWRILLPVQEMWVQSLDGEGPLEEGMATHSSILAWRIPGMEEPSRLQSIGLQRAGHDWATKLTCMHEQLFVSQTYIMNPNKNSGHWSSDLLPWFSSFQSLSDVWLFATPWIAAHQASLSIINSWSLTKPMSIESVMPSNHLILCRPLLLLPSIFPSIRVFSNESILHTRWPKYWSFSFSISPSNEHPGLISFRIDWLDLLAVQGTLKSLLQHHSSKASILRCSAFLTVQLSHPWPLEKP